MSQHRHRVLLVEDNEIIRLIAELNLRRFAIDLHTVQDGIEAVQKAKENTYALILMDIQLPKLSGLDATRLIREAEKVHNHHALIIGVTAGANRQECLEAGMDDHVFKPADYESLLRRWLPDLFGIQTKSTNKSS